MTEDEINKKWNDLIEGRPVSRKEALEMTQKLLEDAEKARLDLIKMEAASGIQYDDLPKINSTPVYGYIWVCTACGRWDYTESALFERDESCGMHAVKVKKSQCSFSKDGGTVKRIKTKETK